MFYIATQYNNQFWLYDNHKMYGFPKSADQIQYYIVPKTHTGEKPTAFVKEITFGGGGKSRRKSCCNCVLKKS